MENKEVAYQTLIKQIRDASPVLKEPERMTQSIIENIEKINGLKQKRRSRRIRITGIFSGIAAGLLLCLLVYDTTQVLNIRQEATIQSMNQNNSLKDKTKEELIKEKTAWVYQKQHLLILIKK